MKVLSLIACVHAAPSVAAPNDGCYWQSSKSGGYVECLPDYYIRAACESVSFFCFFSVRSFNFKGSRDDCHVDGIGHGSSFGIECCPADRTMNFKNPTNCQWLGGKR